MHLQQRTARAAETMEKGQLVVSFISSISHNVPKPLPEFMSCSEDVSIESRLIPNSNSKRCCSLRLTLKTVQGFLCTRQVFQITGDGI